VLGLGLIIAWPAIAAGETDDAPLSEAFLEFLADIEDEQGESQDPLYYEGQQWQILDQKIEKTENTDE
jgi:hypothetical protein